MIPLGVQLTVVAGASFVVLKVLQRVVCSSPWTCFGVSAAFFFFAAQYVYQNALHVDHLCIVSDTLARIPHHPEDGFVISQISDIHYDWRRPRRVSATLLYDVVSESNSSKPDVVVITGDLVQRKSDTIEELCAKFLSKLKSKHGIYAVLGNHDHKGMRICVGVCALR